MPSELTELPTEELLQQAAAKRDAWFGKVVTYSPKVFIPLTRLCRDKCSYCTFAQPPARVEAPFLTREEVLRIAKSGRDTGCTEALFTLGERPELRYPVAANWLSDHGFASTIHYLEAMCAEVHDTTGLLPHANAGALHLEELAQLRNVSISQGMMLESIRYDLACHKGSPDKALMRRLATLEAAGELQIPFTTGLLVGIGDSEEDRIDALSWIAECQQQHGHIQEVIIQNFLPKPGTGMHKASPAPLDAHLRTIALARMILPPTIHVQAPPNLSDDFGQLLDAGADDWGGVSPVTADHVNPERPWPHVELMREVAQQRGFTLERRLPIHSNFAIDPERWVDARFKHSVSH